MVRRLRRFVGAVIVVTLISGVAVGLKTLPAAAEGDNQFPGISGRGTDWGYNKKSPDPNLMWLYKDNGPNETINGKTTHILRNRSIGRNKGTRLRVYYASPPKKVSITVDVVACELDAPASFAGPVRVVLGGSTVYNQGTRAPQQYDYLRRENTYGAGGGARTTTQEYLVEKPGDNDRYPNSPVCNNYAAYNVPVYVWREDCNNYYQTNKCRNAGTGTWVNGSPDKTGNGTYKVAATNTKLDGKTFTVDFTPTCSGGGAPTPASAGAKATNCPGGQALVMGYDSETNLYYADLDIDLDANDQTGVPADVMQRITFHVTANNAVNASTGGSMTPRMGYRVFPDMASASKYFGLEGNGGLPDSYPAYGQKMAIPFGMTCNDARPSFMGTVKLYDPDASAGGYGTSYAAVYRRNPSNGNIVRLGRDDYELIDKVSWDGGNDRINVTGGSGEDSEFKVNVVRGFQYMLAISNPNHPGGGDSSTNVWSLYLPTDSINGLINCRYDLTPKMTNVAPTFNAYGDTLSPKGSIQNSEASTGTGDHAWKITRAVFGARPGDLSRTDVMDSDSDSCVFVTSRSGAPLDCDTLHNATYPEETNKTLSDGVGPYPVGTYVCYITSVKNPTWETGDDNKWRYSTMQCSVAGIKPKVQVWGYDVKATGLINTSLSDSATKRTGSWAEYGAFSDGLNKGFGSGSGLRDVANGSGQNLWSGLTFANSGIAAGQYGLYNGVVLPQVSQNGAIVINGDRTVTSINDLVPAGQSKAVVRINGTLRINGTGLTYPSTVAGITQIPRIVLIANDIIIGPTVTQIDPWLIAYRPNGVGRLSTCSQAAGGSFQPLSTADLLRSGICSSQIKFNSPVMADALYLYRTHDDSAGDPAEIFNVRADAFLSSYVGGGTDEPVATTDSVTELPPRF